MPANYLPTLRLDAGLSVKRSSTSVKCQQITYHCFDLKLLYRYYVFGYGKYFVVLPTNSTIISCIIGRMSSDVINMQAVYLLTCSFEAGLSAKNVMATLRLFEFVLWKK